ncbi:DUF6734 family protein [Croceitalea marina]|uniref:DUF6734 family protein n=1 Tax=Croceitalea marina TaxID=1775166 RepID=A0ABW5N088_9FLAO
MRIIHSFWSRPFLKKANFNYYDRSAGGWIDRRFNYYSWALSCLTFKKFYKDIVLYSDSYGATLLGDKLGLPYTEIKITLDQLDKYHLDLWAIGKLYAYQSETKPFLHVDGDVYIWKRFSNNLEEAALVVQNLEDEFSYYEEIYTQIHEHFKYIPESISRHARNGRGFSGINAGIFGGNDIDFIQYYVTNALELVNKNKSRLENVNIGLFNNFYEQCLFRVLVEEKGKKVSSLLKNVNDRFDGLCDLTGVPENSWYAHAVGVYKKRKETNELIEFRLRSEFPDYYYKINYLIQKSVI